jgi:hypothetical protein
MSATSDDMLAYSICLAIVGGVAVWGFLSLAKRFPPETAATKGDAGFLAAYSASRSRAEEYP